MKKYYDKARRELRDIERFFNVYDKKSRQNVFTKPQDKDFDVPALRTTYMELLYYHRITEEQADHYMQLLKDRITNIEGVIDSHIALVRKDIYQSKKVEYIKKVKEQMGTSDAAFPIRTLKKKESRVLSSAALKFRKINNKGKVFSELDLNNSKEEEDSSNHEEQPEDDLNPTQKEVLKKMLEGEREVKFDD